MQISKALRLFRVQLRADGRSPHTLAQYKRHLALFGRWLVTTRRGPRLDRLDHQDLAAFVASPLARQRPDGSEKRATSMNALRSTLRTFFGYLHLAEILEQNPCRLLRRARVGRPLPRALSPTDEKRLLATLQAAEGQPAERDLRLVRLLLATGMRLSAALGLRRDDVDAEAGVVRIRTKGALEQQVAARKRLLQQLVRAREREGTSWVFPGRGDLPLGRRQAAKRFQAWVRRAGIRPVSLHGLRHTYATKLYGKTRDLLLVQQALGHRSIASTLVYATLR